MDKKENKKEEKPIEIKLPSDSVFGLMFLDQDLNHEDSPFVKHIYLDRVLPTQHKQNQRESSA